MKLVESHETTIKKFDKWFFWVSQFFDTLVAFFMRYSTAPRPE
jgi:hypothetical protein